MQTAVQFKEVFDRVNADCAKTGESVVPYNDVDYYAEQIEYIFDLTPAQAYQAALDLRNAA